MKLMQWLYIEPGNNWIQAFNQYWDRVANGYGLNGAAAQFSLSDVDPITGQVQQMPTLEQLKSWVRNNGEA